MVPSLHRLPEELLQHIVEYLDDPALSSFSLTSSSGNKLAQAVRWREVVLTDCARTHFTNSDEGLARGRDEHDDGPMLRKLIILATNPRIAACVQTVIHRCHLPQPAIFHELPRATFSSVSLSADPRTTLLVRLAVRQMTRVHTLRIIFGHPHLNDALLRCFFAKSRECVTPVRRLWLENCRIGPGCDVRLVGHPFDLPLELDFRGLESVRFRRLPMRVGRSTTKHIPEGLFVYARGAEDARLGSLQDGAGGHYETSVNTLHDELFSIYGSMEGLPQANESRISVERLFGPAYAWDQKIYDELANTVALPAELQDFLAVSLDDYVALGYRGSCLDPSDIDAHRDKWFSLAPTSPTAAQILSMMWKAQREWKPSADVALSLLSSASATLTSVCLDWVLTSPNYHSSSPWKKTTPNNPGWPAWINLYLNFFGLRFPHLRALQFRNAVVKETMHPAGLYLFDRANIPFANEDAAAEVMGVGYADRLDLACLEFMEYHDSLQCLAWPMDGFFSAQSPSSDIAPRVRAVIENLGRNLVDLRVDMIYIGRGELQTDENYSALRERRRRFISDFAAHMTKVESIKIEGGIPRDERRETIRALHACPLKKIVSIGVCSSLGNTWGLSGRELGERLAQVEIESLEAEDKDAIFRSGFTDPVPPPSSDFHFQPFYGWPPSPPLLHTLASYHASTITELKFCGYKGAPVLFTPHPICQPLLHPLRHFHKLESLIVSLWLSTVFEDAPHDAEIIAYWLDARSPSSTSLVRVAPDGELGGWERELKTKFAPDALAARVTAFIGPFLSERAKARRGGVHLRASMCVGDWGGIFDLDLRVGKGGGGGDVCLGFEGPREEMEEGRRRGKLVGRRWF